MNTTIAKMALEWLRAEHNTARAKGDLDYDFDATKDDIEIASDRVYQVMAGEVRWSEAGPGDKAIWRGRMRDVERFEQLWRTSGAPKQNAAQAVAQQEAAEANYPRAGTNEYERRGAGGNRRGEGNRMLRMDQSHNRMWSNWYDTIKLSREEQGPHRLFGSRGGLASDIRSRIGNNFLTNILVPGFLASDMTCVVVAYYVSLTSLDALRWAADNVIAMVGMGDKPQHGGPMFVRDLFMGMVPLRPLIVPIRQHVWVNIEQRGLVPEDIEPFELAFHMEGLVTRDVP